MEGTLIHTHTFLSTTLQLMQDIYGGVTQLAVQIFRSERMSTTFRSYTHTHTLQSGDNRLTPCRCLLLCWTEMFSNKVESKCNWTPPYTAQGFFLKDSGLPCILILVTYDSVYSLEIFVSIQRVTFIVKSWMNKCLALEVCEFDSRTWLFPFSS